MLFACESQNRWELSQTGSDVSGRAVGQCPPYNWTGNMTARVVGSRRIAIAALTYRDSSSHTEIQTLSVSGEGRIDGSGFSGMFAGDFTSTPVFGGVTGPVSACHGTQMAFRFSQDP